MLALSELDDPEDRAARVVPDHDSGAAERPHRLDPGRQRLAEAGRSLARRSTAASRKFEFYVNGKLVRTGKVAVGRPGMETPLGLFYVQAKFDPTWPVLGAYAFETSGYSKLSDWPGGGVVGVHGTNTPDLIGQAVSHGCVRLYNKDIQYLRSVVGVGTPIKIVAA